MATNESSFYFPADITLEKQPLIEAWLELRWQLDPGSQEGLFIDRGFPLALGTFYQNVKQRYGHKEPLPASTAPLEFLPHVVRYRFRSKPEHWPLLQIGPGVASVNFTEPYSWVSFKNEALYLRSKLIESYETTLVPLAISLQYKNAVKCNYSSGNLLEFLKENLNTTVILPQYIPGTVGRVDGPTNTDMKFMFDLKSPKGRGIIQLATGIRKTEIQSGSKEADMEFLLFELRVVSEKENTPDFEREGFFESWLESAHAVVHEWFFSMIDGPLRETYQEQGDNL